MKASGLEISQLSPPPLLPLSFLRQEDQGGQDIQLPLQQWAKEGIRKIIVPEVGLLCENKTRSFFKCISAALFSFFAQSTTGFMLCCACVCVCARMSMCVVCVHARVSACACMCVRACEGGHGPVVFVPPLQSPACTVSVRAVRCLKISHEGVKSHLRQGGQD